MRWRRRERLTINSAGMIARVTALEGVGRTLAEEARARTRALVDLDQTTEALANRIVDLETAVELLGQAGE